MGEGGATESKVNGIGVVAIICGVLAILASQGAWLEYSVLGTERTGMDLDGAFGLSKGVVIVLSGLAMLLGGLAMPLDWVRSATQVGDAAISVLVGGGVSAGVAVWAYFADVQGSFAGSVGFGLVLAFVVGAIGAVGAGVLLFKVEP